MSRSRSMSTSGGSSDEIHRVLADACGDHFGVSQAGGVSPEPKPDRSDAERHRVGGDHFGRWNFSSDDHGPARSADRRRQKRRDLHNDSRHFDRRRSRRPVDHGSGRQRREGRRRAAERHHSGNSTNRSRGRFDPSRVFCRVSDARSRRGLRCLREPLYTSGRWLFEGSDHGEAQAPRTASAAHGYL